MRITLIRHLPTEWNKKSLLQGKRDIDISPPGEKIKLEIAANRQKLVRLSPFDLVLASSLKRTHQTATLYGYHAVTEQLLDELDFGPFEGVAKENLLKTYEGLWMENPKTIILGESLQNLENRIVAFLDKYQGNRNLLVFGHGSWIRAFLSYQKYGDINKMNKFSVNNNQFITTTININTSI